MTPHDEETRIAEGETRLGGSDPPSGKSASHVSSSSGWLSTSEAIDHGRFPPGTVLGGRYRIVGRLGRGGMGEVYRADDLKLAQPVALKFLPPELDRDPARLMQLHNEVRMARQVSHPNVCRVYDIDEVDGHTFLSMEYVDGEELASLLRRIGRFSIERSLELAREICAGLGAAHERGVVHRDLKPANVMIDGTGRVRITDFGLAGVAGESLRAGTPAYMAPEQLAGAEVTARSDIYALGLVLYELFTGQRAIEAKNVAELLRKREAGITAVVMVGFLMLTGVGGNDFTAPIWLSVLTSLIILSSIVYVMLRFGLLTTMTFFVVNFLLQNGVLTLDPSRWFFPTSTTLLLLVAALAFYGFYASRGGEPLLGKRILD